MRTTLAVAVLLAAAVLARGQDEAPPSPRFGVASNVDFYPQGSPKVALTSVVRTIERDKSDYLAAHLIDPRFIDAKVADRARALEPEAERDLRAERIRQRRNPYGVPREERLPEEPKAFAEAVRQEAERRAFKLVAQDIRATLNENPDHLKDFRRFLREGQFSETGDTATATLPGRTDRQLFFRRVGNRWYIEDRREPEAAGKK